MASLKAITLIMALVLWSPSTFLAGTVAPYVKATYEIPDTLIPSQGLSTAHHSVSRFLFQGLFRINRNMLVDPDLVATWEVSRDGRLFRFQLAEAAFSNGDTVTSFDVVNSLRFLIRESRNAQFYYQIEKVYSDGPGTVVVKIAEGFHQLIELLAAPQAGIWKQKNGTILGSGPMMAHRVSAGRLELVSSGNYRGKFRSNLSSLTFLKVEEFQIESFLETGKIHDTIDIPTTRTLLRGRNFTALTSELAVTWLLALNSSAESFRQVSSRSCLASEFDAADFVKQFVPSHRPTNQYLPVALADSKLPRKIEVKQSCLEKVPAFKITVPKELDRSDEICTYLVGKFAPVSRQVKCDVVAFDKMMQSMESKKFEMSLIGMSLDIPAVSYFASAVSAHSHFSLTNFKSSVMENLVKNVERADSRDQLQMNLNELNRFIRANTLLIPISNPLNVSFISNSYEGVEINPLGAAFTDYSRLIKRD